MEQSLEQSTEQKSLYYVFRYFLIATNTHYPLFEHGTKEEIFQKELNTINKVQKINHTYWGNNYTFFAPLRFDDETTVIKLAKKVSRTKNVEKENDLVPVIEEGYDYVHIIINSKTQLVLVQKDSSVFKIDVAKNIIEDYFSYKLRPYYYTLKIDPKTKPEQFWNIVDESDEVFDLSIKINAPNNPLFGNEEMQKAIEYLRDETNNEETVITFKNSTGNLSLVGQFIKNLVHYVSIVGGFWSLRVKKKNNKKQSRVNSYDQIVKTELPKEIREDDKDLIVEKLNEVNGIQALQIDTTLTPDKVSKSNKGNKKTKQATKKPTKKAKE